MESFKKFFEVDYDSWLLQGAPGEDDTNCPACRDGSCTDCGGKGCHNCKHTGDCQVCQGAGEVDKLTAQKYAAMHSAEPDNDRGFEGSHPLHLSKEARSWKIAMKDYENKEAKNMQDFRMAKAKNEKEAAKKSAQKPKDK